MSDETRDGLHSMLTSVVVMLMLGLGIWWFAASRTPMEQIPAATRHALYQRTLTELTEFCDPAKRLPGVEDYCRRQADLVMQFPDCDETCRAIATHSHRLAVR